MTTIKYPDEGRYDEGGLGYRCEAMGRNGSMYVAALEVRELNKVVSLTPITSRGLAGRCCIEIPKDAATLRSIARELRTIAAKADGRSRRR